MLGIFCQQAQQTINDSLQVLLRTKFISSQVIPHQLFSSQVNATIQDWQSTTVNQFVRTIQLVEAIIRGNQLTNGRSNVNWYLNNSWRKTTMELSGYSNCSCGKSEACYFPMGMYRASYNSSGFVDRFPIPNFLIGCFPIEALLASTLECFYNRSCMMIIDSLKSNRLDQYFNFDALDENRNWPKQNIQSIVNGLMVDSWSSYISFTSFYKACAPMSCTYEYKRRNDLFSVITTVIGVFGGLSLAFKILILIALRMTEKALSGVPRFVPMHSIRNLLICRDEQQMTRRLHFVLVVAALSVLYVFSAFTPQSITVKLEKSSLSAYEDLAPRFPNSIQCPCSHESIQYQSFLAIVPRFHQVCSSDFVSTGWVAYLYGDGNLTSRFAPNDFRYSASGQFQLLAKLCQLSIQIVSDTLLQQRTSNFINTHLLSPSSLDERVQMTADEFQATIPNLFLTILALIRETTAANMILSGLATNCRFITPPYLISLGIAHTAPLVYQDCNCGLSTKCVEPS